ncbi:MAG TPA: protein kinase, partial [Ktedonobacteraceae bacterium]|nr:protein kinase [Ktedonobacteraceae bacterium]
MDSETLIGTVLGTTCTLQKMIGQGGMGVVYLALQSRPNRRVAVKVLLPMVHVSSEQHRSFLERFHAEADVVASLVHPNIIPIHEYGERDGLPYLVMPYINGGTLHDVIEREEPVPLEKAMSYLEQLAGALDFAHERGVIHGNIKPANILVRRGEHLWLTDFGLMKMIFEHDDERSYLIGIGALMGVSEYMAPELIVGSHIDARADQYSLGMVMYQMVTGSLPVRGSRALRQQHTLPYTSHMQRPQIPPEVEQVMLKAVARNPEARYTYVRDFASAFRQALTTAGVLHEPVSADTRSTDAHLATPHNLLPVTETSIPSVTTLAPSALDVNKDANKDASRDDIVGKTSFSLSGIMPLFPPGQRIHHSSGQEVAEVAPDLEWDTPEPFPILETRPELKPEHTTERTDTGLMSLSSAIEALKGSVRPSAPEVLDTNLVPMSSTIKATTEPKLERLPEEPGEREITFDPPAWLLEGRPPEVISATQSTQSATEETNEQTREQTSKLPKKRSLRTILLIVLSLIIIFGAFAYTYISVISPGKGPLPLMQPLNRGIPGGKSPGGGHPNGGVANNNDNGNGSGVNSFAKPGARRFQVGAHALIEIKAHSSDVNIHTSSMDTVIVTAKQRSSNQVLAPNSTSVLYSQSHDGQGHDQISIATSPGSVNIDYDVAVPSTALAQVQVNTGSVTVNGVKGVTIDTGGGNLDIENVQGPVNVHTDSGDITAHAITGDATVESINGSIRVTSINGPLKA